jgi:hypothetical protein
VRGEEVAVDVAELNGLVVNEPVDELVAGPVCIAPLVAEELVVDATVFLEVLNAIAPPIPPPMPAAITAPARMHTIRSIFFVKPQYFLGGGGRSGTCFSSFSGIAFE